MATLEKTIRAIVQRALSGDDSISYAQGLSIENDLFDALSKTPRTFPPVGDALLFVQRVEEILCADAQSPSLKLAAISVAYSDYKAGK